ncbi:hypothetical protein Hdeb2414_s0002g00054061 [Helianthus debilis subsp. tardiflorus]
MGQTLLTYSCLFFWSDVTHSKTLELLLHLLPVRLLHPSRHRHLLPPQRRHLPPPSPPSPSPPPTSLPTAAGSSSLLHAGTPPPLQRLLPPSSLHRHRISSSHHLLPKHTPFTFLSSTFYPFNSQTNTRTPLLQTNNNNLISFATSINLLQIPEIINRKFDFLRGYLRCSTLSAHQTLGY